MTNRTSVTCGPIPTGLIFMLSNPRRRGEKEHGVQKLLKKIMAENFPILVECITHQIQDAE